MNNTIICDTPEKINAFRLLALKGALKLETLGMKHSRGSVYAAIKKEFGLKGSKTSVYNQFVEMLKRDGILVDKSAPVC